MAQLVRTRDLEYRALDWAVAQVQGVAITWNLAQQCWETEQVPWAEPDQPQRWAPTQRWDQAGVIIQQSGIAIEQLTQQAQWQATMGRDHGFQGRTALEAAMRCYVGSRWSRLVELPEWDLGSGTKG